MTSPSLPPDVREMVERYRCSAAETRAKAGLIEGDPGIFPPIIDDMRRIADDLDAAAAMLERLALREQWQPADTAPKQKIVLLWAITDTETGNWKMATGCWMPGYGDDPGGWDWDGRRLRSYDIQPTHFMPLPAPPKEGETDGQG